MAKEAKLVQEEKPDAFAGCVCVSFCEGELGDEMGNGWGEAGGVEGGLAGDDGDVDGGLEGEDGFANGFKINGNLLPAAIEEGRVGSFRGEDRGESAGSAGLEGFETSPPSGRSDGGLLVDDDDKDE